MCFRQWLLDGCRACLQLNSAQEGLHDAFQSHFPGPDGKAAL